MLDSNINSKQKKEKNNINTENNKDKKNTPENSMIEEEDGIRAIGGA